MFQLSCLDRTTVWSVQVRLTLTCPTPDPGVTYRGYLWAFSKPVWLADWLCDCVTFACRLDNEMHVKVADFGLSRDIYERDYYSSDNRKSKLPVKWMALESLEKGIYNSKTDVVRLYSSFVAFCRLSRGQFTTGSQGSSWEKVPVGGHLFPLSFLPFSFLSYFPSFCLFLPVPFPPFFFSPSFVGEHLVLDYYCTLQFDLFTGQFGYLLFFLLLRR